MTGVWLRMVVILVSLVAAMGSAGAAVTLGSLPSGEPLPRGESAPILRPLGPLEYSGIWEYKWGDSPRAAWGALEWARSYSHSSEWTQLGRFDGVPGRNGSHWLWLRSEIPPNTHTRCV